MSQLPTRGRLWPRLGRAILVAVLLVALPPPIALSQDTETVAAAAKASVGILLVERTDGVASGTTFMAADRLVLTANHVVVGARRLLLKFPDYPSVEAMVHRTDAEADIAVLAIPKLPVRPLPLGDMAQLRPGQKIVVISYPRVEALGAQTPTVTEGIVSAIRLNVLQIQAPISPGSSGGPVLNSRGEVVGIVRATLRGEQQGINFATAVNAAKPILGAAVLALSTPAQAQLAPAGHAQKRGQCEDAQTQQEMNECARRGYEQADRELNKSYRLLMSKLRAEQKPKLRAAQLHWIRFRDANCEFEALPYQGGTMYGLIYTSCLTRLTEARTKELKEMIREFE